MLKPLVIDKMRLPWQVTCAGITMLCYALLGNTQILDILTNLGNESIATCTIVKGELIDMAARSPYQNS